MSVDFSSIGTLELQRLVILHSVLSFLSDDKVDLGTWRDGGANTADAAVRDPKVRTKGCVGGIASAIPAFVGRGLTFDDGDVLYDDNRDFYALKEFFGLDHPGLVYAMFGNPNFDPEDVVQEAAYNLVRRPKDQDRPDRVIVLKRIRRLINAVLKDQGEDTEDRKALITGLRQGEHDND